MVHDRAENAAIRGVEVKRDTGFTLVELLIVIAILLIIAAMAIPNFLRAKMAANEASAVSSCRTLNTAEFTYNCYYQRGYTASLAQLGPPGSGPATVGAADLIDVNLASGQKSGYIFVYTPGSLSGGAYNDYQFRASPAVPNTTGIRSFYTDPSGVIRMAVGGSAGPSSSPVQ
jgi:type IV pilus assembly protein PilA